MKIEQILDLKHKILLLNQRITIDFAKLFLEGLHIISSETNSFKIVINSVGGKKDQAVDIGIALWKLNSPDYSIEGVVTKQALSSAFYVLQNCQVRSALINSELMWHRVGNIIPDSVDPTKKISNPATPKQLQDEVKLNEFIAYRSNRTIEEVYKLANEDRIMKPIEAKALGFIDVIYNETPPWLTKGV